MKASNTTFGLRFLPLHGGRSLQSIVLFRIYNANAFICSTAHYVFAPLVWRYVIVRRLFNSLELFSHAEVIISSCLAPQALRFSPWHLALPSTTTMSVRASSCNSYEGSTERYCTDQLCEGVNIFISVLFSNRARV